jgi:REP element-mobilizing transposase RayT
MGRPLRIEYPGALYHITSRGNERKEIFLDDENRTEFLEILHEYHDRYGILIHSYVLMDNHYHLILETPQGNLLKVMHGINGRYTGYFNRRYERSGHLFQGRYKGILVDKDAYLTQLSRYVHLNPVRARIAARPEQYKWSSYPGYIGKTKENPWVEYAWVLSKFGQDVQEAKKKYRAYVEEGITADIDSPLKSLHGQVVLGVEEFIGKIKKMLDGKVLSREILERKRLTTQLLPSEIITKVALTLGVEGKTIIEKGRRDNIARKVAIYFVQRYAGLNNEEIGQMFGGIHFSAVSKATAAVKEEMIHDKELSEIIKRLDSNFKA